MSGNLNKCQIIGHLGADPETRYFDDGNMVANISVATTESWKDKQTGEKQERTQWHRIVMYRRLAEIAAEYLRKGSLVYIEGKLRTRKWQDRDGNDRYTTEVIADRMLMLGGKRDGERRDYDDGRDYAQASGRGGGTRARPPADDFDDDIPF